MNTCTVIDQLNDVDVATQFDKTPVTWVLLDMQIKVCNDQERAQSDRNSHSKNRGGKHIVS